MELQLLTKMKRRKKKQEQDFNKSVKELNSKEVSSNYTLPSNELFRGTGSDSMPTGMALFRESFSKSLRTMRECKAVLDHMKITGIPKLFYNYLGAVPECFSRLNMGNHQGESTNIQFNVLHARHPADVLWENQGLSALEYTVKNLLFGGATLVLIVLSFLAALKLKQWQNSFEYSWMASLGLALGIKVFNMIFSIVSASLLILRNLTPKPDSTFLTFWRMSLVVFNNLVFVCQLHDPPDRPQQDPVGRSTGRIDVEQIGIGN